MRGILPEIKNRGAHLVIIGNGRPEHARKFIEMEPLDATVLCDPNLKAYKAAGLRRSVLSTMNPLSGAYAIRAMVRGNKQESVMGDNWQQGGVFVITPKNEVLFSYVSMVAGDHPKPSSILASIPNPA